MRTLNKQWHVWKGGSFLPAQHLLGISLFSPFHPISPNLSLFFLHRNEGKFSFSFYSILSVIKNRGYTCKLNFNVVNYIVLKLLYYIEITLY